MRTLYSIVLDLCKYHAEPHHRWNGTAFYLESLLGMEETDPRAPNFISSYLWTNYSKVKRPQFDDLKRELFQKQMQLEKLHGL